MRTAGQANSARHAGLWNSAQSQHTASMALLAVSIASAATSAALFYFDHRRFRGVRNHATMRPGIVRDRDLDRIGDACDPSPDRPDLAVKAGGFVSVVAPAFGNSGAVAGVAGIPWGREQTRSDAGLIAPDLNRALRR